MSFKSEIVEAIMRLRPRDGQFSIEALGNLTVTDYGKIPSVKHEEDVSRFRKSLFNSLLKRQECIINSGGLKTFNVVSLANLRLSWMKSSSQSRKHWDILSRRACVARWLYNLPDRDYESACVLAMQVLGATQFHVTRFGDDFGIDFFALIPAYTKSTLFLSGIQGLRIIGQSKKYSSPVARKKIQSFNDCITSVRNNRAEMLSLIPSWFRSNPSPILSCFIAHSGFQSGSIDIARQAGHITLDSLSLAGIIARPNIFEICISDNEAHRILWTRLRNLDSVAA